jgi:divalent metal cation (Fe/Co/Zn/Cd) transporter
LILVVFLAVIAIYVGFFTINRTIKDVDVTSELNQGNKAIGIFVASVFIGITLTVYYSCIQGILGGVNKIFADGSLTLNDSFDVVMSFLSLSLEFSFQSDRYTS